MPVRVAVDATPLLGTRTGVGAFVAGVLPALAHRDDLRVGAFGLTWSGRRSLPRVVPADVEVARVPMIAGALLPLWSRCDGPAAEWWTGRTDVVHGTNFVVPPARHAAEVVTVHDLTSVRFPELCAPASLAYPELVRRAIRRGAWIHTPSEFVAREVVELLGAEPERVRAVAHGVHAPPARVTTPPAGQDRYVLALGTAEPRKDLPGLVQAFDAVADDHPDVRLLLAGAKGWGEAALAVAIDSAVHRSRITRLGYLDDARRAVVLAGAAVLAYPSVYEGFGLPPLEALAAGVPVVATRAGAVPEVVGDVARLVEPGDTDALAGALAAVLDESEAERATAVEAGKRHAAHFTWERCAAGLAGLYHHASSR
jgi:glycosyltransferase involved in cell wall biosynthesis